MVEKQLDAQGYLKKILLARIYDLDARPARMREW